MDYEKMYKAVLETATQWIKDGCSDKEKICLESIFPELRESEDERIRKFLIQHVSEWIGCIEHDLKISSKDIESERELAMFKAGLAYLEKQKECVVDNNKTSAEEDERIRARLIEYFQGFLEGYEDCYKDGGCVKWEGLDVKSILAWLEKQKENANSFIDGVIEVRSFQRGMEEGRRLEGQKEQKHLNGCFTCDEYKKGYEEGRRNGFTAGYNKAMKEVEQKEQKPVEYLSKDKVYAIMSKLTKLSTSNLIPFNSPEYKKINEITSDIRSLLDYPIEQKPRWEINNPHTTKWTKEMIDEKFEELVKEYHKQKPVVTHGETYHVDTLGTQQVIAGKMPQKPAEWSKEDEEMLNSCISSIEESKENRYAYKENDGDTSYDREIAWLKSLRPVSKESLQPHWKPSEEQMEALNKAIPVCMGVVGRDEIIPLESLYNDLKKLI